MKLNKIGNNETEVMQGEYIVLYSYNTPVAIRHIKTGEEYRTTEKYSSTTSKHLNKWCSPSAEKISQADLEKLLDN